MRLMRNENSVRLAMHKLPAGPFVHNHLVILTIQQINGVAPLDLSARQQTFRNPVNFSLTQVSLIRHHDISNYSVVALYGSSF